MAIPAGRNFASCYMELCKRQRLRPLPVICVTLPHSLDFTTDRVKMDDWGPILNSISLDRSLRSIGVHSRYQCRKPLEEINSEDKARAMGKAPVVVTRYLLEWLSQSVGQCVRNSSSLTHLELEGIPFPPDCVAVLCVGLSSTETLHHLSLRRCYIGDTGCELICRTIADIRSVRSLNLSHCDLTSNCGSALASALSRQKLSLYHDTWKQSLRYRDPDFEAMPGLRRLTLNDNPHLGNCAVREVIDAIRDSLWLKALDLQRCGLTDQIGADLLELLDHNNTLAVLDVRKNVNLNEQLATEVMRRLAENDTEGNKSEYKWMGPPPREQRTASAGTAGRGSENEDTEKAAKAARPRSAYARRARKSSPKMPPTRKSVVPMPILPAKTKIRRTSSPPPVRDTVQPSRVLRPRMLADGARSLSKVSLHLDLRPPFLRSATASQRADRDVVEDDDARGAGREEAARCSDGAEASATKSLRVEESRTRVDVGTQSVDDDDDDDNDEDEMKNILGQLTKARAEQTRLLDETRRADCLLAEERERREAAETSLRSAQNEMAELESALRRKEDETRGYLLVSQQSLDEICLSFDRLLEMLESVTASHRPADGGAARDVAQQQQQQQQQQQRQRQRQRIARADIERRLASVIRQTKSENLKKRVRTAGTDAVVVESPSPHRHVPVADSGRKCAKSESDVRSTAPIPATRLETRIGECPENKSPRRRRQFRRNDRHDVDEAMSPGERARAIFASIVSGDAVLDLC